MQLKVQHVFKALKPYVVAADMGLALQESNGHLFVRVPRLPDSRLFLTDTHFISDTYGCSFMAGGVFDLMALVLGSYEAAVDTAFSRYPDLADNPMAEDLTDLRYQFVLELKNARENLNLWLNLRKETDRLAVEASSVSLWLRQNRWPTKNLMDHLWILTDDDLIRAGIEARNIPHTIILPSYSSPGVLGQLVLVNPDNGDRKTVTLQDMNGYWFGLPSFWRGTQCLSFSDQDSALKALRQIDEQGIQHKSVLSWIKGGGTDDGCSIPYGSVVINSNQPDFVDLQLKRSFIRDMTVCTTSLIDPLGVKSFPTPWLEFAMAYVQQRCLKTKPDMAGLKLMFEQMRHDATLVERIKAWLKLNNLQPILELFTRRISGRLEYSNDKILVHSTENGYLLQKIKGRQQTLFTNFTVNIQRNIWFPQSEELVHYGVTRLAGKEADVMITRKSLQRPRDVEGLVNSAIHGQHSQAPAALITDTTYQKYLTLCLNSQANRLPKQDGIYKLGWDEKRTQFQAAPWAAGLLGVTYAAGLLYPFSDLFKSFRTNAYPSSGQLAELPGDIQDMLVAVLGLLYKGFYQVAGSPLQIQWSMAAETVVTTISRAFGQVEGYALNQNSRPGVTYSELRHCQGLPLLLVSANQDVIKGLDTTQAYYVLSDKGMQLKSGLTPETYVQLFHTAQHLFQQASVWLCRNKNEAKGFLTTNSVTGLQEAGRRLLRQVIPDYARRIPDPKFPALVNWWELSDPEQMGKTAVFSLAAQEVGFKIWTDTGLLEVMEEIRQAGLSCRESNGYLYISASLIELWPARFGFHLNPSPTPASNSLLDPIVGVGGIVQG